MVRSYKRKTEKQGKTSDEVMRTAVNKVLSSGTSVRQTARVMNISKSALNRYVNNAKNLGSADRSRGLRCTPNYQIGQVFSSQQEQSLEEYLLTSSKHHHGLTTKGCRELAYQYGKKNKLILPKS